MPAPLGDDPTEEVTDLLCRLIRNRCVNDGSVESGQEVRSAELLESYLEGPGLDIEHFEPEPGRRSLVARIEGRDPNAPGLLLMGHTDVVPANEDRWRHDPFGGEVIDGEVWGRGAVDMLNLTASMAVAMRRLARRGFRPDGSLTYLAVADEEALGTHGASYLVANEADAVAADYVITESGGIPVETPDGVRLPVMVAEKGTFWCTLRVTGTPGHGSQAYNTDNALVKAAHVVQRIAEYRPATRIHDTWKRFLPELGLGAELIEPLLDPDTLADALPLLPEGMARLFHACTHTTMQPTVVRGGTKINVVPDAVEVDIDIRIAPEDTGDTVRAMVDEALGDLKGDVEVIVRSAEDPTSSPVDTPLFESLDRLGSRWYPGSKAVPFMIVGATDARFFRSLGATAYGFGLFSRNMTYEDYASMFHGDDERVDVESLRMSTELWEAVAADLLVAVE